MSIVASVNNYWISPDALTISLNAMGDPDMVQVSVLANAVIIAYVPDVINYNAAHNYQEWILSAVNTKFETSSAKFVYAKLDRNENSKKAILSYSDNELDIYGEDVDLSGKYFYIYLGKISSSIPNVGIGGFRTWEDNLKTGKLRTDQYIQEEGKGEWAKMFRLNTVTDLIEVLKDISSVVINKLFIGKRKKEITDVKTSTDEDLIPDSDEIIPTCKYVKNSYVSRINNDNIFGFIDFIKGFSSKGLIKAFVGSEYGQFSPGALGTGACIRIDPVTGKSYFEVDELFVRLKAVFTELVIKEMSHVGGEIVLTPASMRCVRVEELEDSYRCYFKKTDGDREITNDFVVGDQACRKTFNIKAGTSHNASNRYYWRLVTGTGDDYIDLSKTDCDARSDVPAAGDDICQFGNRDDKSRQNAIVLSSYGADAPSMKQYVGIDSYSLVDKCKTRFSPSGNLVTGELRVESGEKVEDVILDKVGCQVYVYTTSGNLTLNGNINETLYAEVWRGSENITDTIMDSLYSWQRISTDPTGDAVWNKLHEGVGKSIVIGNADVVRKAMFVCNVVVNNELLTSLQ